MISREGVQEVSVIAYLLPITRSRSAQSARKGGSAAWTSRGRGQQGGPLLRTRCCAGRGCSGIRSEVVQSTALSVGEDGFGLSLHLRCRSLDEAGSIARVAVATAVIVIAAVTS